MCVCACAFVRAQAQLFSHTRTDIPLYILRHTHLIVTQIHIVSIEVSYNWRSVSALRPQKMPIAQQMRIQIQIGYDAPTVVCVV